MVAAVELRKDFDAAALRRLARRSKDSGQARRLLAQLVPLAIEVDPTVKPLDAPQAVPWS